MARNININYISHLASRIPISIFRFSMWTTVSCVKTNKKKSQYYFLSHRWHFCSRLLRISFMHILCVVMISQDNNNNNQIINFSFAVLHIFFYFFFIIISCSFCVRLKRFSPQWNWIYKCTLTPLNWNGPQMEATFKLNLLPQTDRHRRQLGLHFFLLVFIFISFDSIMNSVSTKFIMVKWFCAADSKQRIYLIEKWLPLLHWPEMRKAKRKWKN